MKNKENQSLYIRNMVCDRCIRVVREELQKIGVPVCHVELGKAEFEEDIKDLPLDKISQILLDSGFEIIEGKKAKLIETAKNKIIQLVQQNADENPLNINYSDYLSQHLNVSYNYLSNLFSSVENITLEQYIILQKIERAKELLKYDEDSLNEISYKLGYSSVQYLSNQFKKVTGLTASQFRKMVTNLRIPLDKVL